MLPWRRREWTASGCRRWSSAGGCGFRRAEQGLQHIELKRARPALACVLRRSWARVFLEPAVVLRLDPLRRADHRRLFFFRRGQRQFGRRSLADIDRDGRRPAVDDRARSPVDVGIGIGIGIGVSRPAGRPAIEGAGGGAGAAGATSTCSGLSGSSRNRLNSSARRMAASMRNCRHSGWSPRAINAPCTGRTPVVDSANEPSGGLKRQDQEHYGEEYAAYWKDPKNRQHRL